jgi:hypothetical protein
MAAIRSVLGKILVLPLLLAAACSRPAPELLPAPVVLAGPAAVIETFTTTTIIDRDDPNQAHGFDHFGGSVAIEGSRAAASGPQWGMPPGMASGAVFIYHVDADGEFQLEAELVSSSRDDAQQEDMHFGEVNALQGDTLVVGAPGYDDQWGKENIGAVYVFEFDGQVWSESAVLIPNRLVSEARLGSGVAVYDDLIAVSGGPAAGNVYLYQKEDGLWTGVGQVPVPTVTGSQPNVMIDLYGSTLAVSTVTIQPIPDDPAAAGLDEEEMVKLLRNTGVVTLFERQGDSWQQVYQTPSQEAALYRMYAGPFGIPISLSGEAGQASLLAVGKPGWQGSGCELGSVAIFARRDQSWRPEAELMLAPGEMVRGALPIFRDPHGGPPPDPGPIFFGAWVELQGERLAVVSTFANTAYIFDRQKEGWVYQYLVTPAPQMGDDFQRRTVSLSENRLLLGSPGELGGGHILLFVLDE